MQHTAAHHSSWKELVALPPTGAHLLQIYDCHEFLAAAVGHYAAAGLQKGEAVRLDGTQAHLDATLRHLGVLGVDAAEAQRTGRLALGNAEAELDAWSANGPIERAFFDGLLDEVFGATNADPRWTGFRWWAEFAPTMQRRGDDKAARMIEAAAADALLRHKGTIFCSALCDRFDAAGYDHMRTLCSEHTHAIPADDYVVHRLTVNRAIAEVVGDLRGSLLNSLSTWKGPSCDLPSSQALLFWLRDTLPEHFEAVLARARACDARQAAGPDR
jgi:hypothetical protein